jgi:hypothetical protein
LFLQLQHGLPDRHVRDVHASNADAWIDGVGVPGFIGEKDRRTDQCRQQHAYQQDEEQLDLRFVLFAFSVSFHIVVIITISLKPAEFGGVRVQGSVYTLH